MRAKLAPTLTSRQLVGFFLLTWLGIVHTLEPCRVVLGLRLCMRSQNALRAFTVSQSLERNSPIVSTRSVVVSRLDAESLLGAVGGMSVTVNCVFL